MSPPPGRPKEGSLPLGGQARSSAKGAPITATRALPRRLPRMIAALGLALSCAFGAAAFAQSAGPSWQQLSTQQRAALTPLEGEWAGIDESRKRKWLDIADRMPKMSPDERQRVQGRMADWSRLSPDERGRARQRYQESRTVDSEERQQRWEAYQALPAERRRELAQGARTPQRNEPRGNGAAPQKKSNIVPNPEYVAPPKPVAPTVQQARPGATTTLMSRPSTPPAHQQTGLPKIAVTPGFVDRKTLLPQRGPQGAATRPAPAASAPGSRNR